VRQLLVLALALAGCIAISKVPMEKVTGLQIQLDPPQIISGERWKKVFAGATCHDETKKWHRGKDAVLLLDDGSRVGITGVSDIGHFIRISDIQWCQLTDKAWAELWKQQ
jgi:hypothetical protein